MSSSSAQAPAKVPEQVSEPVGSHDGDVAHSDDVHTVQLGGAPASLLATKHAKPTTQKNNEATCGTAARLPQSTHQLHDQSSMLPLERALSPCYTSTYRCYTLAQCVLAFYREAYMGGFRLLTPAGFSLLAPINSSWLAHGP